MDELPRKLGFGDATLIIIGIVIGSGIFLLPTLIARNLASPWAIITVWVVSGLLSCCGALASVSPSSASASREPMRRWT